MAENGVLKYDKYMVPIFFEAEHTSCQFCPLLETYARNQCRRTGEYILDTRSRGVWCPLIKIDDTEDEDGFEFMEETFSGSDGTESTEESG